MHHHGDSNPDPGITLPALRLTAAGLLPFELARVRRRIDADVFAIAGDGIRLSGSVRGSVQIEWDALPRVLAFNVEGAEYSDAEASVIGVRRTCNTAAAAVTETLVLLPSTHTLIAEWTPATGTAIDVCCICATDAAIDLRWNHDERVLILETSQSSHAYLCLAFTAPVLEWNVTRAADGMSAVIRARVQLDAQAGRLHIAAGKSPDAIAANLDRASNAEPLMRSFVATERRRGIEAVALETPLPALDSALRWAHERVAMQPLPDDDRGAARALHVLAALAVGAGAVAHAAIARIPPDDPLLLLAAARMHAWTADTRTLMQFWPALELAITNASSELEHTTHPPRAALLLTALAEIAAVAGDIGKARIAENISARVKRERITRAQALRSTSWLDALADDPAAHLWRRMADPAVEPDVADILHDPAGADPRPAEVILPIVHGIFGIQPEAARNRLRVAPRMPAAWPRAALRRIRMGDASIDIEYTADAGTFTFRAVQQTGGVPVRLILEPSIPAASAVEAEVDGVPAQLDIVPHERRMVVPVQIVLDDERVVVLRTRE